MNKDTELLISVAERYLQELDASTRFTRKGSVLSKAAPGSTAIVEAGMVEGYASTFDRDPDSSGDVVAKGAFLNTLAAWRAKEPQGIHIPLLYGHRNDDPRYNIGAVMEAYEDGRGLYVKAKFDANNPTAQAVRELVKQGRLFQFSFAYEVLDSAQVTLPGGKRANELRRLNLFEVSLVQTPANQRAIVTDIKGVRRVRDDGMLDALRAALSTLVGM